MKSGRPMLLNVRSAMELALMPDFSSVPSRVLLTGGSLDFCLWAYASIQEIRPEVGGGLTFGD